MKNQQYELKAELVHGDVFCITNAETISDHKPCVIKYLTAEYPRPEDIAALKFEYHILKKLNIHNVIKTLGLITLDGNPALVLEDFQGKSIRYFLKQQSIELKDALHIMIELAEALRELHAKNIIHKDINPNNIVWNPKTGVVKLIDFNCASELPVEKFEITHVDGMQGTVAYMSPEQTGRLNRGLNYRSDFYSLGVTFFEILTGRLPFESDDIMELLHFHIAKEPPAASDINPKVPPVISNIILKCMEKNPEDRYQSAYALLIDLKRCFDFLQKTGSIKNFKIAEKDYSDQLNFSGELFGREVEKAEISRIVDEIKNGSAQLLLIGGYSGVGKSALAFEMRAKIAEENGYFAHGKCDQFKKDSPYLPLVQAISQYIQKIFAAGKDEIEATKKKILNAVGSNGKLIIDLIPALEKLIGKQPAIPKLEPVAAQALFEYTMIEFLKALSTPQHPLILFIDDLQWADSSLLKLIKQLFQNTEDFKHFLLLGAYRENEVDDTHPLRLLSKKMEAEGKKILTIHLQALAAQYAKEWIASIFHEDLDMCEPLSEVVYQKTLGNPFFIIQLLSTFKSKDLIRFNFENGSWHWDVDEIKKLNISDNVVDLMLEKIAALSPKSLKLIQLAACIGSQFDLKLLAISNKTSLEETMELMQEILKAGFILPIDDSYKYITEASDEAILMKFSHDKVQQAAYSMLNENERKSIRYDIGQILLKTSTPEKLNEDLLSIVGHLNAGADLIKIETEKLKLIELNLRAGQKASFSNAYDFSLQLLTFAIDLLPENSWKTMTPLTSDIYLEAAKAATLSLNSKRAYELIEKIIENSKDKLTFIRANKLKVLQYASEDKLKESANLTIEIFKSAGFPIKDPPSPEDFKLGIERVQLAMGKRSIASLAKLPKIKDPVVEELLGLAATGISAMYIARPEMFLIMSMEEARLSIEYGNAGSSAAVYVCYGVVLSALIQDVVSAYAFGDMGLKMQEHIHSYETRSYSIFMFCYFTFHWQKGLAESLDLLLEGYEKGLSLGEFEGAGWCLHGYSCNTFLMGKNLDEAREVTDRHAKRIRQLGQKACYYLHEIVHQAVINLQGESKDRTSFLLDSFEDEKVKVTQIAKNDLSVLCKKAILETYLSYIFNNREEGLEKSNQAKLLLDSIPGSPFIVPHFLYRTLTLAALYPEKSKAIQKEYMKEIDENLQMLEAWSHCAPMNYAHKFELCHAEKEGLLGKIEEADALYQAAIKGARENGFQNEEALALEAYADFCARNGFQEKANKYIKKAHDAYLRWGAKAKVAELEEKYRDILSSSSRQKPSAQMSIRGLSTTRTGSSSLDLASAMKAVSLISGEIYLDKLIPKMLNVMIENAGAQSGIFIENQSNVWKLVAKTTVEGGKENFQLISKPINQVENLPKDLISYVQQTEEAVVLGNAINDERFSEDPYIKKVRAKSLLCMPILQKGEILALILLENNISTHVFTEERIQILQMLGAQVAISLENARHVEKMQNLYHSTERFVPKRFLEILHKQNIEEVVLGDSVRREISVLFNDIRSFTSLVENREPEEAFAFVNRYWKFMAPIIRKHGGYIDQYQGDAILAIFANKPEDCVKAAIEMMSVLADFNKEQLKSNDVEISMGIGISTGPAMLGVIGEEERQVSGLISDVANTAARVEGLNKLYGSRILLSDATAKTLPDNILRRQVDKVRLMGKKNVTEIFEVIEWQKELKSISVEDYLSQFKSAFEAYQKGDLNKSISLFSACLESFPNDKAAKALLERCQSLLRDGLPADWDGAYTLTQK